MAIVARAVCAEAGAREAGTWIQVNLSCRGQTIEQASITAYGCPYTLKVCEWLGGQLRGRGLDEAACGGPHEWARANEVPEERLTRLLVIEDALLAALRNASQDAYNGP
jgi:hypothetical protein